MKSNIPEKQEMADVRADAVVFMPEPKKMICIDSQSSFQDYQRIFDSDDNEESQAY